MKTESEKDILNANVSCCSKGALIPERLRTPTQVFYVPKIRRVKLKLGKEHCWGASPRSPNYCLQILKNPNWCYKTNRKVRDVSITLCLWTPTQCQLGLCRGLKFDIGRLLFTWIYSTVAVFIQPYLVHRGRKIR